METNPLLFCGCVNLFRKHCSMHTNNLGIFLIINCEGLVVLAEHKSGVWGCTFDEALGHLYADFREWCSSKSIRCSHRRWYAKHLHLMTSTGEKSFGWLNSKAYNARVILAWLAETCLDLYVKTIFQIPKKSCCNLEMLKHDLFLKKTTLPGCLELPAEWTFDEAATREQRCSWAAGFFVVFMHRSGVASMHLFQLDSPKIVVI